VSTQAKAGNLTCRTVSARAARFASPGPKLRPGKSNLDLVEGFDKWLTVQNYSQSTRVNYCHDVRALASFTGQVSLLEVKRDHVAEYLQYLQETRRLSPSSLARMLFSLRKFYSFLKMGEVVQRGPLLTIPTRKVPKRLPDPLSEDQIEQLLRGARSPRDLAVLELFYASGVRRAELCAINCEDVYFDADGNGGSVNIAHGKGDKQRSVIIGKYAAKALRAYLEGRSSGSLFLTRRRSQQGSVKFYDTRKGGSWSGIWADWEHLPNGKWNRHNRCKYLGTVEELPTREAAKDALLRFIEKQPGAKHPGNDAHRLGLKAVERIVKKAARRAGLGNVHPHQLRHSMASHMRSRGTDLLYIARLLGHTSLVATQKYMHVTIPELIKIHEKFHPSGGSDE
jgi:site-specific recombinase XerD